MKKNYGFCGGSYFIWTALYIILTFPNFAISGLVANCQGPNGACTPGTNITITIDSGSDVTIPRPNPYPANGYPDNGTWLQYCPSKGGGYANCAGAATDKATLKHDHLDAKDNAYVGVTTWFSLGQHYVGTFLIPADLTLSPGTTYCIAGFLTSQSGSGEQFLNYGTKNWYPASNGPQCVAEAPPPVVPQKCAFSAGDSLDVTFGNIERKNIGVSTGSGNDINKTITITCDGGNTHNLDIKLSMTPVNWSDTQILTSNEYLGVSISTQGKPLKNNDVVNVKVNGTFSMDLSFSLNRNPAINNSDIPTGAFKSSAVLVVTEI